MPTPAPRYAEEETLAEEHGWPEPRPRRRPAGPAPAAAPRPRRSPRDHAWVWLAILGLALGAAAAIWYLSLNRTAPPATLTVPRVLGRPEAAAVRQLTREGFNVRAVERPGNAEPGHVFAQRPAPFATLARGATVTIRVADGRKP